MEGHKDYTRSVARFEIDKYYTLRGQWALNSDYIGVRPVGDIYDIVLCFDDKEICYMTFKKQKDGSLKASGNFGIIHCARQCASHREIKEPVEWVRDMQEWVELNRSKAKKWILEFLEILQ